MYIKYEQGWHGDTVISTVASQLWDLGSSLHRGSMSLHVLSDYLSPKPEVN